MPDQSFGRFIGPNAVTQPMLQRLICRIFLCVTVLALASACKRAQIPASGSVCGITERAAPSTVFLIEEGKIVDGLVLSSIYRRDGDSVDKFLASLQPLFVSDEKISYVIWDSSYNREISTATLHGATLSREKKFTVDDQIAIREGRLIPFDGNWIGCDENGKLVRLRREPDHDRVTVDQGKLLPAMTWKRVRAGETPHSFLAESEDGSWFRLSRTSDSALTATRMEKLTQDEEDLINPENALRRALRETGSAIWYRGGSVFSSTLDGSSGNWLFATIHNDSSERLYSYDPRTRSSALLIDGYVGWVYPPPFRVDE